MENLATVSKDEVPKCLSQCDYLPLPIAILFGQQNWTLVTIIILQKIYKGKSKIK